MFVMPVDRPNFAKQAAVARPGFAELLLDGRIDENALHFRVAGRLHHQTRMSTRPFALVDRQELALVQHRRERQVFALLRTHRLRWLGRKPYIRIKADLVGCVAGDHRATTRLRNIADQNTGTPAQLGGIAGKALEK